MPDYRRILWEGRRWILAAVALFFAGATTGLVAALVAPETVQGWLQPSLAVVRDVGARLATETSPVRRTSIIFRSNGLAVLWTMVLGLMPFPFFGFWPAASTVVNGTVIGVVAGLGGRVSPLAASPGTFLLAILPHGVVELPALWIGAAWGMRLGLAWLLPAASGRRFRVLGQSALEAAQVFVLASVLLLVAAAIEANVTPALVRRFGGAPLLAAAGILWEL